MKISYLLVLLHGCTATAYAQIKIEDLSPRFDNTDITITPQHQSVSGKALCVATSADGSTVYLGGHSGVWRSVDGGLNWEHCTRPQPGTGCAEVIGALPVPNVYDLLVSSSDKNLVLAAVSRDLRKHPEDGIYRSADGAQTWTQVHQFIQKTDSTLNVGKVGCLTAAPDNPERIYAAGQFAVGISADAGKTWTESVPEPGATVHYVAAGVSEGSLQRVYAAGSGFWYSEDGGQSWSRDTFSMTMRFPTDAAGIGSRALAVHPTNPTVVYIIQNEPPSKLAAIWRGDFSDFSQNGSASWVKLPTVPIEYSGTTASGGNFIWPHVTPEGTFYLVVSDRRTVHLSVDEPDSTGAWTRIDGSIVHVDPHGIAITRDFRYRLADSSVADFGHIFIVNDGGVVVSSDGLKSWSKGNGLATLGIVNAAVLPNPGGAPGICIGMGDNYGFFTPDGGKTWKTQEYLGGDNDVCFVDPKQPNRLIVFAPRSGPAHQRRTIFLYAREKGIPDGSIGTEDRLTVVGPPPLPGQTKAAWNCVSWFYNAGYRPLVLTLPSEDPRPDGDLVIIRQTEDKALLLRTTAMSQIRNPEDWVTTATTEDAGSKVFQQGPDLPDRAIDLVQPSGGHENPVFYIAESGGQQRLWKWRRGMSNWKQLVPVEAGNTGPAAALRYFADPYLPQILYVLDANHVYRSDDGGNSWIVDWNLEQALTQNGSIPLDIQGAPSPGQALFRDILFDPIHPNIRFAIGPAGVFYTKDGTSWKHLLLTCAMPMRPNNAVYDPLTDPANPALYVTTNSRGLLRITGF